MPYSSQDGQQFTNRMAANSRNASLKGGMKADPAPAQQSDQPQSIEDDPKAMQLVDELKNMGYTADDVAKAMGDDGQQDQQQGSAATSAAPMQIPGM